MFYFISRTMNMKILFNIGRGKKTELTYIINSAFVLHKKAILEVFFWKAI